jgi:hypothetical protein
MIKSKLDVRDYVGPKRTKMKFTLANFGVGQNARFNRNPFSSFEDEACGRMYSHSIRIMRLFYALHAKKT